MRIYLCYIDNDDCRLTRCCCRPASVPSVTNFRYVQSDICMHLSNSNRHCDVKKILETFYCTVQLRRNWSWTLDIVTRLLLNAYFAKKLAKALEIRKHSHLFVFSHLLNFFAPIVQITRTFVALLRPLFAPGCECATACTSLWLCSRARPSPRAWGLLNNVNDNGKW